MNGTVPSLSIVFMAVSCLIGFALPVALLLYFRIRKKADILPFFTGCAVMLIFALILEAAVHRSGDSGKHLAVCVLRRNNGRPL